MIFIVLTSFAETKLLRYRAIRFIILSMVQTGIICIKSTNLRLVEVIIYVCVDYSQTDPKNSVTQAPI